MKHILSFILIVATGVNATAQLRPESVCDVLADLVAHSGKMIVLRDRYDGDNFIGGGACAKPIWVGGIQFENIISMEWPGNPAVKARKLEIPFQFDPKSAQTLEHGIANWDRRSQDLIVTLEGMLITRTPPLNLLFPRRDPPQRAGFGHEAAAPAEIIIKQVREVSAIRRQ